MSSRSLDDASVRRLAGVDPRLVSLVHEAFNLSEVPFIITEGVRSPERQGYLFASGKSRTLRSKHILQDDGFGHAVDVACLVNGKISWEWKYYEIVANAFKRASYARFTPIAWGGNWEKFPDGCHFELR